ncbi:MAG: hypothetical protein ACR2N4_00050 [Jatrophihabitans sp.]
MSATVESEAGIRSAVSAFVNATLGWSVSSCTCSAAVALAFGGNAWASAMPAIDAPSATIAGSTGDSTAVSFSGRGQATADAVSGGISSGTAAAAAPEPAGQSNQLPGAESAGRLARQVRQLVDQLVTANGQTTSSTDPLAGFAPNKSGKSQTVSVQVATTGELDSCAAKPSCAVAVSIAVEGTATSTITAPGRCSGLLGSAEAIAIAVRADARATASRGIDSACSLTSSAVQSAVSAVAGNTGATYSVSLAATGAARAAAHSGHLGAVSASADHQLTRPSAVALSGSTGDSAGIAIGGDGAASQVSSGDSGHAAASCSVCGTGSGVSEASTGDTGSSFALAGAGLQATVQATSGNSGNADASVAGVAGAPSSTSGGKAIGHSGSTGNAIAEAVDLSTWVTVTTHSGDAGAVISVSRGTSKTAGGGSIIKPSAPSHTTVHTGPMSHAIPKSPALISAVGSTSTRSTHAGSQSVTTTSRASAHSRSADVSSSATGAPAAVVDPNLSVLSPTVVPAAETTTLRSHQHGSQVSSIGLITMPFLLLALVALLAVVVSRSRRVRRQT